MDIVTLCIVLIILQPIIVYFAFFKNIAATTKYNEFYQSFLVLPPSLSLFYTDQYWSALGLLIGVTVVGIVLAKMINHKANPHCSWCFNFINDIMVHIGWFWSPCG
ncbi:hypothetical protein ABIS04_17470 [Shewanella sp. H8]|uniref:hypothetical protein n=1 Tax=Shewanella sp. H8 TaxID=3342676 RepID=UPI003314AA61